MLMPTASSLSSLLHSWLALQSLPDLLHRHFFLVVLAYLVFPVLPWTSHCADAADCQGCSGKRYFRVEQREQKPATPHHQSFRANLTYYRIDRRTPEPYAAVCIRERTLTMPGSCSRCRLRASRPFGRYPFTVVDLPQPANQTNTVRPQLMARGQNCTNQRFMRDGAGPRVSALFRNALIGPREYGLMAMPEREI
jgi:hypothetical protein